MDLSDGPALSVATHHRPLVTASEDRSLRFAHPVRRILAYLLDGLLLVVVIFAAAVVATAILGPTVRFDSGVDAGGVVVDAGRTYINAVVGTLISALYFIGSWCRSGRTPGQAVFGIRVGHVEDGSLLGVPAAIVRWAALGAPIALASPFAREVPGAGARLTLGVGVWLIALLVTTVVDRHNRGLHDRLSGSAVFRVGSGDLPGPQDGPATPASGSTAESGL